MTGGDGDLWLELIVGDTRRSKCEGTPHLGGANTAMMWRAMRDAIHGFVGHPDGAVLYGMVL